MRQIYGRDERSLADVPADDHEVILAVSSRDQVPSVARLAVVTEEREKEEKNRVHPPDQNVLPPSLFVYVNEVKETH